MGGVIEKLLSTIRVGSFDQFFHEGNVGFASIKVATAAQHQRLVDAIFQMAIGRFHVAVFIRASWVGSFCFAVVVAHQCRIAFSEFTLAGMISNGSSQRITAMPLRDTTEFPERLLNAGTERFKRFRKTQRNTFGVAVGQYAVEECMIESPPGNLDAQFIADCEVTRGQSPTVMLLIKEGDFARPMQTSPLVDATFKCATSGIRKLSFVSLLQPFKERLRFESRFDFQSLFHFGPDFRKRINPRAIISIARLLRREPVAVAVLACRLLAHFRHPC